MFRQSVDSTQRRSVYLSATVRAAGRVGVCGKTPTDCIPASPSTEHGAPVTDGACVMAPLLFFLSASPGGWMPSRRVPSAFSAWPQEKVYTLTPGFCPSNWSRRIKFPLRHLRYIRHRELSRDLRSRGRDDDGLAVVLAERDDVEALVDR
ncbi:unnamed protein product [Lota lota]